MNPENRAPLLLLHGFPLDERMWRDTIERFRPERLVLAPGATDLLRTAGTPSMRAMAARAAEVVDEIAKGRKVVVVGLSMGGYIALEFCKAHPDRVAGLVLCDTRATADTPEARQNRDAMIAAVRENGVTAGTAPLVEKLLYQPSDTVRGAVDAIVADQRADVILGCIQALRDREDNTATLEALDAPVLALSGEQDALAPPSVTEDMAARAKRGRAALIPNAGHVPPMEQPGAFNAALAGFLQENGL